MALDLNSGPGQAPLKKGVFISRVVLDSYELQSGNDFNGKPLDFKLVVTGYKDNERKQLLFIQGTLGKNSWGSAIQVRDFFKTIGAFDGLNDEEVKTKMELFERKQIPADFLAKIKGATIKVVSFSCGITNHKDTGAAIVDYKTYPKYFQAHITDEEIVEDFESELVRREKAGYPLKYDPDAWDRLNANSDNGAPQDDSFDPSKFANQSAPVGVAPGNFPL